MLLGEILTIAELPIGVLPAGRNFGVADPFRDLDPNDTDLTYLLELLPFDPEKAGGWFGPPAPIGTLGLGCFEYSYLGSERAVYLGDHHNYVSLAGDVPANTPFRGRLDPAYSLKAQLGSVADPMGAAQVDIGNIAIQNGDRDYDFLMRCSMAGRPAQVKVGKAHWSYNVFATALFGTIAVKRAPTESAINLGLTTILSRLDGKLQLRRWAGTGGAEGSLELAGRIIPVYLGQGPRSLPGILEDAATNIWRFALELSAMTNPRDRGVAGFTGGVDYPNRAALAAATLSPGDWATCIAEGRARYGSTVTLPTIDAVGPASVGIHAGGIALHIARSMLGARLNLDAARVDAGSFNRLDALRPWPTGIYIDSDITARQAINQVMTDVGAAVIATRDGLLACVAYTLPSLPSSTISDGTVDTNGIGTEELAPVRRVEVTFAPRIRKLDGSELTESVPLADQIDLAAMWQIVDAVNSLPDAMADEIGIATGLRDAADAQALADLVASLRRTLTRIYTVPPLSRPFLHWLGDHRRFSYQAYEASAGLDCIVIGLTESSGVGAQIQLWGPPGTSI